MVINRNKLATFNSVMISCHGVTLLIGLGTFLIRAFYWRDIVPSVESGDFQYVHSLSTYTSKSTSIFLRFSFNTVQTVKNIFFYSLHVSVNYVIILQFSHYVFLSKTHTRTHA